MAKVLTAYPATGTYDAPGAVEKFQSDYNCGVALAMYHGPMFSCTDEPALKKMGYDQLVILRPSGGVLMEKNL